MAETATGLVGVIGGMGPLATVEFYRRVVDASTAVRDQEHIPLLIWGDPRIPDRSEAITRDGEDPTTAIRSAARTLVDAGAEQLVVACNTAHAFLDVALDGLDVPLLSLVDETVRTVVRQGLTDATVAILATDGTIASGVYQQAFAEAGVSTLTPAPGAQHQVMQAIRAVKASDFETARRLVSPAVEHVRAEGADVLLAGCTELPLILGATCHGLPVLDPMTIAAQALVRQRQTDGQRLDRCVADA